MADLVLYNKQGQECILRDKTAISVKNTAGNDVTFYMIPADFIKILSSDTSPTSVIDLRGIPLTGVQGWLFYQSNYTSGQGQHTKIAGCLLPDTVTYIGSHAFSHCDYMTSIAIPDAVTKIDEYAFDYCSRMVTVTIGQNSMLRSLGQYAFDQCQLLTSISLPDIVSFIGDRCFLNCKALSDIHIPTAVTTFEQYVFGNCAFTSFTIPSQITTVKANAFRSCASLATVTFLGTPTSIVATAFSLCTNLTDIYVPWAEGAVAGAPWGATNAQIHYSYTPTT